MKHRNVVLAGVASYALLGFDAVFTLASLPRFLSTRDWGSSAMMLGLMVLTGLVVFVYPKLPKVLAPIPYGWEVAVVSLLSALVLWVGLTRMFYALGGLDADPISKGSDLIISAAASVALLANIVAIVTGYRSGEADRRIAG
jgi:hypothetical protein